MSPVHLETARVGLAGPELAAEIQAMNRAFLTLLSDPQAANLPVVLGLDASIAAGLRALAPESLDELARTPVLLADFAWIESDVSAVTERAPESAYLVADNDAPGRWLDGVRAFANRLLATLWYFSRADAHIAACFMGLDRAAARQLARLSFAELNCRADRLCSALQVRHAQHPGVWSDLIRLAAAGHADRLSAAQLAMIPLSVAAAAEIRTALVSR